MTAQNISFLSSVKDTVAMECISLLHSAFRHMGLNVHRNLSRLIRDGVGEGGGRLNPFNPNEPVPIGVLPVEGRGGILEVRLS